MNGNTALNPMTENLAPTKPTSTTAILALVFGILAWVGLPLLGAIAAIVCGHIARSEIRNSPVPMEGEVMALVGLILGWGQLIVTVLVFFAVILFLGGLAAFFALIGFAV